MKKIVAIALMIFITMLAWPAVAEDQGIFDVDAFIKSADVKTTLKIGLVDCVAMSLENNYDIQIKKISPLIEDANVLYQRGKFDPHLSFDFNMEDNTDLSPLTLFGVETDKTRTGIFNFGYEQLWVTGTRTEVNFYNTRTRSNSIIQSIQPEFDSEAELTVTQPLLKGFGIEVNKADFLIAKNNKLKSIQDLKKDLIDILTDTKKSYYDFQYTQEQYKVAMASLKRVMRLYDIIEEKYAKGLASNVDILQSESDVARFEQALFASEEMMQQAEDRLKLITSLVDDPVLWNADIILLDDLSYKKEVVQLVPSIKLAFAYRPDYEAEKINLRNKNISVVYYRNNMLPTLDLVGSYGLNGLGKNFEKDLGHIGGGRYPDWSVGVSFNMPFFNDREKGDYEKAKLDKKRTIIGFKKLEQNIVLEVRNAVRNVNINYKLLEASIKRKDAEEKNYVAQEARFKAGLVSTLDILIYQENLARAELDYVKSVIDYNVSLIELVKAEGMTLINDNINIIGD